MYITKISKNNETWIVAICLEKNQAVTYLQTLSEEKVQACCYKIEIENFPLFVIENLRTNYESESYFEFRTLEQLQEKIEVIRLQKLNDPDYIYFKYYFIDEDYFQVTSNQNYMLYLRHTNVTNDVLEDSYAISVFHEQIKKCASNYDIDGLDKLFEQTKTINTSKPEKEDLAINGYDSLFWDMNYDHACGKLTDEGIESLLPMVENMEILLKEKKWQHRSYAFHILLENACTNKSEKVFSLLKDTIEAFENYLVSNPDEKLDIHRLVSMAYRWMIEADSENALLYWQNALLEIKKAIDFNPEKASWLSLFELIYIPVNERDGKIVANQIEEQKILNIEIHNLEKERGAVIAYQIALAYHNLQEHCEWKKIKNVFQETLILLWAEKALAYNPAEISRISLYECAEFFNQIGVKAKRIDFLQKTISIYERILKTEVDRVLEVYYIANIYKQIAEVHLENKQQILADIAIEKAKSIYEDNIINVKSNSSANLHYAQFLEYCFNYHGNITKPTIQDLKSIANEIEIQSEGFLSYPYLLLMRIALYENSEEQAIIALTKTLILHELLNDSDFTFILEEFENSKHFTFLMDDLHDSNFKQLKTFLNKTKLFMEEVKENYYYDPELKWEKLRTMPAEELSAYWEKRKEQIRNRQPLNLE